MGGLSGFPNPPPPVYTLLALHKKNPQPEEKVGGVWSPKPPLILNRCAYSRNQVFEALDRTLEVFNIFLKQSKEFSVAYSGHEAPPIALNVVAAIRLPSLPVFVEQEELPYFQNARPLVLFPLRPTAYAFYQPGRAHSVALHVKISGLQGMSNRIL